MRWTRKTTSRVRRERLPFPSVVPRAVSREGRVRRVVARRRVSAAAREPRGVTGRHALARARRSNPDPSRFHRVSNPDARAESEPGDARTVADAASGGVVTEGARFDPTAYVREKNNATRRGSETARGVSPAARARRARAASPARERPGYGARGAGARGRIERGARRGASGGRRGRTIGADRRGGESPGRVLRDVKNKLEDLASKGGADAGAEGAKRAAGAGKSAASGEGRRRRNRRHRPRLAALQNFLKEAKSGAGGAAGEGTA